MRIKTVNYDEIAGDYNYRYQKNTPQGTLSALRRILSEKSPKRVLEIGAGTCYWLALLFGTKLPTLVGIDKSHGMLKQSVKGQVLHLCQALAEKIPIKSNSFNFLYCVNALHHFLNPDQFISEAARVLKPNGTLAIIGMNPRDRRNNWYVYDFFEGTLAQDLVRFPDWAQVEHWLQEANFDNFHLQDVDFIHDPKTSENVLEDPFLQKNGCSQLALLSPKAYQCGLNKIRLHIKNNLEPDYQFKNDILLSMLQAQKKQT
jgi:ubiquinone/menaquinone biosynthesis C-methylase UbiE